MNAQATNIHPIFEKALTRAEKEAFLKQHSKVIWLTGLSGSGKSTIALGLEKKLLAEKYFTELLDGDNVRSGINNNLGFSNAERKENNRRIAEVSKLFIDCGIICLNCFVSPTVEIRKIASDIIGRENYLEIYVNTPLEECEKRDVKGLYKKARAGEINDFTGIHQPFEEPNNPDLEIRTVGRTIEECVQQLYEFILPKIRY
ncbi:MAG: adenylyl-sulfate kinase [Flavobacteriales bacterium]